MQELPVINRTQKLYEGVSKITEKLPALKQRTIGQGLEQKTASLIRFGFKTALFDPEFPKL